jgi:hypothetical protein
VIVFAHDSTAATMPVRPWHRDGTAYYFVQNTQASADDGAGQGRDRTGQARPGTHEFAMGANPTR